MTEERREDVMRAVYAALCAHGYARLTMQDIADESSLSKGTLHYHYDTKRDLLLAFLEYLFGRFTDRLSAAEAAAGDDPVDRLAALVDAALLPPEDGDVREFRTAMLEIEAQAPYEPAYRDRLADFDAFVEARVARAVADGVELGRFPGDVDPDAVASFVATAVTGAHTRNVATDRPVAETRRTLVGYVEGLSTDEAAQVRGTPDEEDAPNGGAGEEPNEGTRGDSNAADGEGGDGRETVTE